MEIAKITTPALRKQRPITFTITDVLVCVISAERNIAEIMAVCITTYLSRYFENIIIPMYFDELHKHLNNFPRELSIKLNYETIWKRLFFTATYII